MHKPQIIVLCEDPAQWHFIREYLMLRGWNPRKFQPVIAPFGRGAAEQWVRRRYAREVKAYRKKSQYQNIALIVMTDADKNSVTERKIQLNHSQEMKDGAQKRRMEKERIAIFVPKRILKHGFIFLTVNFQMKKRTINRYIGMLARRNMQKCCPTNACRSGCSKIFCRLFRMPVLNGKNLYYNCNNSDCT